VSSTQATAGVTRPAILTVDDDPDVLRAVERDLRRHYSGDYRVVSADSGPAALDVLRELEQREIPVAIVVADQRMPGMTGVELLYETRELFPDVKTVLLTAYADTAAAIAAINKSDWTTTCSSPGIPPSRPCTRCSTISWVTGTPDSTPTSTGFSPTAACWASPPTPTWPGPGAAS
jgi:thioredoxin reductase (NADPH)